ncbi:MAG: HAD hydrolase-like protein [Microbacterium sp.]|uniref:HAD hydrolase-like protein n=1 Tax=Microbacterium sp. TaxID=51671 RepID=UPI003A8854D5
MAAPSPCSCVLWDMDGTIVDASEGILRRLGLAMQHFGHPEVTRAELVHWIGPPMFESFQTQLGMSPGEAADALVFYRTLSQQDGHTTGARLFPGIAELLHDVHTAGIPQAIASSKPEVQVLALLDHFDLTPYFTAIVGAAADESTRSSKSEVVGEALRRLAAGGAPTDRPVLVGDRHHDVEGGAEHGVPVVFVRWGFSWPHESEGAQASVDDVAGLRALILPEATDA